ncbi:MAG TPA: hypothetical protein VHA06_06990 [Candidatus Angelobacter sp.]|jgi:hypothetical protein|nr:hypothetical protein [Candidatus Angelobacter sp.]
MPKPEPLPLHYYAMTYEEVAVAMGYTDVQRGKKCVASLQHTALQKLRARPGALKKLVELSILRQQMLRPVIDEGEPR